MHRPPLSFTHTEGTGSLYPLLLRLCLSVCVPVYKRETEGWREREREKHLLGVVLPLRIHTNTHTQTLEVILVTLYIDAMGFILR